MAPEWSIEIAEAPSMTGERRSRRDDVYEIRVKGVIDERWSEWFEGLEVSPLESGETILTGPVVDQAALHGLLQRIRDVGLPLMSVTRADVDDGSHRKLGGE
jgi:hypothetical protein